jgi:hypothetical protein
MTCSGSSSLSQGPSDAWLQPMGNSSPPGTMVVAQQESDCVGPQLVASPAQLRGAEHTPFTQAGEAPEHRVLQPPQCVSSFCRS